VLKSSFRSIRARVDGVRASGDYLLTDVQNGFFANAPLVINDRLGTTTALDPSCGAVALGPPWVLMSCPQSSDPSGPFDLELYSLADGTRQTVTLSPGMPYCSSPPYDSEVSCSAVAVGADWIEWIGTSYHHLPTEAYFQNIQTGELRGDPTNATTFADLNSPALTQTTCPGVRVMRNSSANLVEGNGVTAWGSLTPYGQFALAVTDHGAFLERCGTSMRRLLTHGSIGYAPDSSAGAIVWQAAPGRLTGVLFPSLQTFTIPLPAAIVQRRGSRQDVPVFALGLTSGALYVEGYGATLWRTASPTALPANTSRPTLTRSGSMLTCGRGSWSNADRFSYDWWVNGTTRKRDNRPRLAVGAARNRRSVSCSVTASNAMGTTTASSDQLHVR